MLLKKGDNNEDVKKLQVKLGVDPIGNFGPKTEEAVKAWQRANGLNDDGVVGNDTWNKLMSVTPTPVATPTPAPTILVSSFKLDNNLNHLIYGKMITISFFMIFNDIFPPN
jgi:peptidoglycan hydrolase-like protein with peptidoglycan-binding domain